MSAELNATCKHDNVTGICKNKDACKTNLTSVKLEPCNEGDLSLVCCPIGGINNRPKRTPGEKARESTYNVIFDGFYVSIFWYNYVT